MLRCEQQSSAFSPVFQQLDHVEFDSVNSLCPKSRRIVRTPILFEPDNEAKPVRFRRQTSIPKQSKRNKNTKKRRSSSKFRDGKNSQIGSVGNDQAVEEEQQQQPYTLENYNNLYELSQNLVYQSLDQREFAPLNENDAKFLRELGVRMGNGALNFLNSKLNSSTEATNLTHIHIDSRFKQDVMKAHTQVDDYHKSAKRLRTDDSILKHGESAKPASLLDDIDADEIEELSTICRFFHHSPPSGSATAIPAETSVIERMRAIAQCLGYDPFEEYVVESFIREKNAHPRANCKETLNEEIARLEEQADQLDAMTLIALDRLNLPIAHENLVAPLRAELASAERSIRVLFGKARPTTPYRIRERHRPSITAIERAESTPSYMRKRYRRGHSPPYQLPCTKLGTLVDAFRPQLGYWTPAIILEVRNRSSRHKDVKLLYCHIGHKPLLSRIRKLGFTYPVNQLALSDSADDCKWVPCAEHLVAPMGHQLSEAVYQPLFTEEEISAGQLDL